MFLFRRTIGICFVPAIAGAAAVSLGAAGLGVLLPVALLIRFWPHPRRMYLFGGVQSLARFIGRQRRTQAAQRWEAMLEKLGFRVLEHPAKQKVVHEVEIDDRVGIDSNGTQYPSRTYGQVIREGDYLRTVEEAWYEAVPLHA